MTLKPESKNTQLFNYTIRSPKIRVIHDGKQIGLMSKNEAMIYAQSHSLDLIEIAKQENISICIVADYGKYKYEQSIKEKNRNKQQVKISERELWFSPTIGQHDLEREISKLKEFLSDGDHVRIVIRQKRKQFKQPHQELWYETMHKILDSIKDVATVVSPPQFHGKAMSAKVSPAKQNVGD